MKYKKNIGIIIFCTLFSTLIFSKISVPKMTPRYFEEYKRLNNEIYEFYNSSNRLPFKYELSESAISIIDKSNGINYSLQKGSSYLYEKSYPINIPLVGILTLGAYLGGAQMSTGSSQSPEILTHNAKIHQ